MALHGGKFQLTAARRRLDSSATADTGELQFQLTAARRRLVDGLDAKKFKAHVSTHSRPKAAGCHDSGQRRQSICFNSQPPEGGWLNGQIIQANLPVSTHSRPKAAGFYEMMFRLGSDVSTHSRPKAAGAWNQLQVWQFGGFNSQPPEGGWVL